jgi:uncharacterized membrane protein
MWITLSLVAFYLFTPIFILYLCNRFPFLNKLGSIVIAYAFGLVLGGLGLLPPEAAKVQEIIANLSIPLAIPLMLFSANLPTWSRLAGSTFLSMLIAVISIVVMVVSGYLLFSDQGNTELWKVGGLLVGVYTGGTPNLAALKMMLDVDNNTYLVTHSYDMLLSAVYFFFLISIGKRVFGSFLPQFIPLRKNSATSKEQEVSGDPMWELFQRKNIKPILMALGLSIGIFTLAAASTLIVPENSQMIVVILIITTLGILLSMVPKINTLPKTFELGMYLVLIFSLDVASMVSISQVLHAAPALLYYVSWVIFGSLIMHVVISALFKIDRDTVMVTSTALICSPPFVPAVAGALKNKEIVVSGLTVGIIGYAVGNYLGVIIAQLLQSF